MQGGGEDGQGEEQLPGDAFLCSQWTKLNNSWRFFVDTWLLCNQDIIFKWSVYEPVRPLNFAFRFVSHNEAIARRPEEETSNWQPMNQWMIRGCIHPCGNAYAPNWRVNKWKTDRMCAHTFPKWRNEKRSSCSATCATVQTFAEVTRCIRDSSGESNGCRSARPSFPSLRRLALLRPSQLWPQTNTCSSTLPSAPSSPVSCIVAAVTKWD